MSGFFGPPPPEHLPDKEREKHPSWRRTTRRYKKKKQLVRDMWIVSGLLMIPAPFYIVVVLALTTTLLSFAILDETP
ncbi:MAG: hypothetical protein JJU06_04775 [Ectothiorhodospiraceae bacterium]|nr:hypothetical protein [Ectothiorhodospiraceae bacterium]MCH8502964.1 hypothetical protein [Ectothiorhodospiraceae bacterium]